MLLTNTHRVFLHRHNPRVIARATLRVMILSDRPSARVINNKHPIHQNRFAPSGPVASINPLVRYAIRDDDPALFAFGLIAAIHPMILFRNTTPPAVENLERAGKRERTRTRPFTSPNLSRVGTTCARHARSRSCAHRQPMMLFSFLFFTTTFSELCSHTILEILRNFFSAN